MFRQPDWNQSPFVRRAVAVTVGSVAAVGLATGTALPAWADPDPTPTPSGSVDPTPSPSPSASASAAPTQEPAGAADLKVAVRGAQIPVGSKGKTFYVDVTNVAKQGAKAAKNVVVRVQTETLIKDVQLQFGPGDQNCKAGDKAPKQPGDENGGGKDDGKGKDPAQDSHSGNDDDGGKKPAEGLYTCAAGTLAPGAKYTFSFNAAIGAEQKAKQGAGRITATASFKGKDAEAANNKATKSVDIVGTSSDLNVQIPDAQSAHAGNQTGTFALIGNFGSSDAGDVNFKLKAPKGTTVDSVALKDQQGGWSVPCKVDEKKASATCAISDLKADKYVTARIILNVSADATPNSVLRGGVGTVSYAPTKAAEPADDGDAKKTKQEDKSGAADDKKTDKTTKDKPAPKKESIKRAGDDPSDNKDTFGVPVKKASADLAVAVNESQGQGKNIELKGVIGNNGPSPAKGVQLEIVAPSGTTFADQPQDCTPDATKRTMKCVYPGVIAAGKTAPFKFKMTISGTPGNDGKATVSARTADPQKENNSIGYTITGGGGNDGGGDNGGGDDNGGNNGGDSGDNGGDSGDNGSTGGTDNGNTGGGSTGDTVGNSYSKDQLPVTGDKSGLAAGIGAGLFVLGAVLLRTGRQRRWYVVKY